MVNWKRVVWITLFFLMWYCWPTEGLETPWVISIKVSPQVVASMKRTTFHIIYRIERHADNRMWSLAYGCESGESNGSWGQMEGESAAVTYDIYRDVSAQGGCTFEACVYRGTGKPYRCASQKVVSSKDQ